MTQAPDLPDWAALTVAFLILLGAGTTLIGSIGLLRLKTFYERVHAPTLGTTLGTSFIVLASIISFSLLEARLVLDGALVVIFVTVTTPITLMLLARAALHRGPSQDNVTVPSNKSSAEGTGEAIPPD